MLWPFHECIYITSPKCKILEQVSVSLKLKRICLWKVYFWPFLYLSNKRYALFRDWVFGTTDGFLCQIFPLLTYGQSLLAILNILLITTSKYETKLNMLIKFNLAWFNYFNEILTSCILVSSNMYHIFYFYQMVDNVFPSNYKCSSEKKLFPCGKISV